ncbi:MAG: 6-carboxytetrahydropterin synthase [Caulobacteraceae bacterium]
MTQALFDITKAAAFDAAHRLPGGPAEGPYTRLHGHSFRVEATLRGLAAAPVGWVEDLGRLDVALKAAAGDLDHSLLNDHAGLESPTLEALCLWFAARLAPVFPTLRRIAVSRPTVGERCEMDVGAET